MATATEKIMISDNGEMREATENEIEEIKNAQAQAQSERIRLEEEKKASETKRSIAIAKLASLGLDENDLKALGF